MRFLAIIKVNVFLFQPYQICGDSISNSRIVVRNSLFDLNPADCFIWFSNCIFFFGFFSFSKSLTSTLFGIMVHTWHPVTGHYINTFN
jgi:hypothetical protein